MGWDVHLLRGVSLSGVPAQLAAPWAALLQCLWVGVGMGGSGDGWESLSFLAVLGLWVCGSRGRPPSCSTNSRKAVGGLVLC